MRERSSGAWADSRLVTAEDDAMRVDDVTYMKDVRRRIPPMILRAMDLARADDGWRPLASYAVEGEARAGK